MNERGLQLLQTANRQIGELLELLSTQDERALRRPCPGREKLGDGTIGATAQHERDILRLALEAAARGGDPDPELIEHTTGTREAVTTTGSWVYSDEASYLIAMRGKFSARRPRPPVVKPTEAGDEFMSYPVQVLIVEIASGRVTDSGSSPDYPHLASVGPVVIDYRGSA
jgi:hypothetical protein